MVEGRMKSPGFWQCFFLGEGKDREAYRDLEVHHLLHPRAHLVVEAVPLFAGLFGREHKVPLALLRALHYSLVIGADDTVVDVERATGLDLSHETCC